MNFNNLNARCFFPLRMIVTCFLIFGVNATTKAQSCDFTIGNPVSVPVAGTPPSGFSVIYVLADAYGVILEISNVPTFSQGTTENLVQATSFTYPTGNLPTGLSVGQSIFSLAGCYCFSNHIWLIGCGANGASTIPCAYTVNNGVSVQTTGVYNATPACVLEYIIADDQGNIVGIESSPNFSGLLNGGAYEIYAISSSASTPLSGLSLGQNISNLNGCFEISDYIGVIVCDPVALPIELVYFNAELNLNGAVDVSWITSSERNNDFFTVYRSRNGYDWDEVARINGAGNSNTILTYTFIDEEPHSGFSYYKLKQTDFDGDVSFSDTESVYRNSDERGVLFYPNPSSGNVTFNVEGKKRVILIYSTDGKLVNRLELQGEIKVRLHPGFYHIVYKQNEINHVEILVVN